MTDHPDDKQLDQSHATLTQSTRERQRAGSIEMTLVAAAAMLISISTVFSAWNNFELRKLSQEEGRTRETILLGTECMVEQLAEHRHLTSLAHRAGADHHHYPYPIAPDQEPPPIPGALERSCAMFIHTTTSSTTR